MHISGSVISKCKIFRQYQQAVESKQSPLFPGLFIGVAILFGLEHHRLVVGIIAEGISGLLIIRRKKLRGVVLAHGVTNLGLGIYVLFTGNWTFW